MGLDSLTTSSLPSTSVPFNASIAASAPSLISTNPKPLERPVALSVIIFAEYGTVTSAKIITDRMTNRSRGFGFVEMSDGAEAAIESLNGTEVDGRELVVNESRPKDKS